MNKQKLVKDKVSKFGEVFTGENEVNEMLNLVNKEVINYFSRFLEPACGDGNFLIKILETRLNKIKLDYKKNENEFKKYCIIAVSSIYGIDIQLDHVVSARKRLVEATYNSLTETFIKKDELFHSAIKKIVEKNVIVGDALSLKDLDNKPIVFSEWSFIANQVKRKDYTLSEIIENSPFDNNSEHNLFTQSIENIFIARPFREFDLINFMRVGDQDE
jgi:hypothetical protein